MVWSASFPPVRWTVPDTDLVINQIREALDERKGLVPAQFVPAAWSRWEPMLGTPKGGDAPRKVIANFQYQIQEMLTLAWGFRWFDFTRDELYTLANLLTDAFGEIEWTYDLTAGTIENPTMKWTCPYAVLFDEIYKATNKLVYIRILPSLVDIEIKVDSVYQMTFGIVDWPAERAAAFALFAGPDGGITSSLTFDVGLGAEVIDYGGVEEWYLENRKTEIHFNTAGFLGYLVSEAALDVETVAPAGVSDFSGTFVTEVTVNGNQRGTFTSNDYGVHRIDLVPGDINTGGETIFTVKTTKSNTDDRLNWAPAGPDYTSTYREGFEIGSAVRLIVKVNLEYD